MVQHIITELENKNADFKTISRALTSRLFNWIIQDNDYSWDMEYMTGSITGTVVPPVKPPVIAPKPPIIQDEEIFQEGKEKYELHKRKERNAKLIKTVKQERFETDPELKCEICGFSFVKTYGEIGKGFIEAHHIFPISELEEETETKKEDIILVCSNCHRIIHRKRPWLTIEEAKKIIEKI